MTPDFLRRIFDGLEASPLDYKSVFSDQPDAGQPDAEPPEVQAAKRRIKALFDECAPARAPQPAPIEREMLATLCLIARCLATHVKGAEQ